MYVHIYIYFSKYSMRQGFFFSFMDYWSLLNNLSFTPWFVMAACCNQVFMYSWMFLNFLLFYIVFFLNLAPLAHWVTIRLMFSAKNPSSSKLFLLILSPLIYFHIYFRIILSVFTPHIHTPTYAHNFQILIGITLNL